MFYLILSDSHRNPENIREVLARQLTRPAGVFFLGDGVGDAGEIVTDIPLYAVCGNCDGFLSPGDTTPAEQLVTVAGLRVLLTHGHLFGVKSGPDVAISYAVRNDCDVLLFGHTHEVYEETLTAGSVFGTVHLGRTLHVFNPGSIADGNFGVLTVRNGVPLFSHGTL